MRYAMLLATITTVLACLGPQISTVSADDEASSELLDVLTHTWRDDPTWHDGKAEYCSYDSIRFIYGVERRYQSKLYTNKELADPKTKTKSRTSSGREVFKQHMVEVIPTDNYEYKFSTMCYVGSTDLKSLKIDMGSQDDCGTTFKQFVNHSDTVTWHSFVYFPGAGHEQGSYPPPPDFVCQDALSLILRGYPFNTPLPPSRVNLLPSQTSPRKTSSQWIEAVVSYVGREILVVPAGRIKTHHLRITGNHGNVGQIIQHDYWFAASATPPRLHVMVRYEGPAGRRHELSEHRRWAYWKR